jgi:hypothetical protein
MNNRHRQKSRRYHGREIYYKTQLQAMRAASYEPQGAPRDVLTIGETEEPQPRAVKCEFALPSQWSDARGLRWPARSANRKICRCASNSSISVT